MRYGNVLGSRGSVVPIFLKQKNEKFFTVTDKNMTRFNISLPDAAKFAQESPEPPASELFSDVTIN